MDTENLIRLIQAVSDSALTGLRYEEDGVRIHLTKKKDRVTGHAADFPVDEEASNRSDTEEIQQVKKQSAEGVQGMLVTSPLVGVFYAAPSEEAAPFVQVGDVVKKGQTLGIVEAMKLMNHIESEYDGTVKEILVKNGQNVEYHQPLFRIG